MKLDEASLPALPEPPFCSQCGQTVNEFTCGPTHAIMRHEWQTLDRLACARAGALVALDEAFSQCANDPDHRLEVIRRLRDTIAKGESE